ncbi:MAG: taurine transporter substrate binding subunit [Methanosaeta sp. PtaU1.Bin112]|nr:MAG: taurine transporter substrate binding subunit [Methanosaeta sp. PtaU1.Bin112]
MAMLVIIVLFSSGCITSPESKTEKVSNLRIGYQPTTHHVAEMIAQVKGWWQRDLSAFGITEIKEFGYPSGGSEMQAMKAGDIDIAYICTAPFIRPVTMGLDAKIVVAVNTNGSTLILRPDLVYEGPQSLRGLHIGTFPAGTAQDTLLKVWLENNGINTSEVAITSMGPGDAVSAMFAGRVDGVFLPEPGPAMIELEKKGRSWVRSGEMQPNHACCAIVVSGKLIREEPELVEQIIRIHMNATDYANAHPMEAAEIYSNRTGQDLEMIKYSIMTWDGKWMSDPHVLVSDTIAYAKAQYEMNYTQKNVNQSDLFDNSLYDKVMQSEKKI